MNTKKEILEVIKKQGGQAGFDYLLSDPEFNNRLDNILYQKKVIEMLNKGVP